MLENLGKVMLEWLENLGKAGILFFNIVWRRYSISREIPLLIQQIYSSGVLSLVIIIVASLFIGMVLALQGYHTLNKFSAGQQLGPLVALSITRELGPVVSAILFAGRAGSAITAEISLMQATEQLASMEMLAVDPIARVISPRFWGGVITLPLLTIIFNTSAILGAFLVGVHGLGLDSGVFWSNMQASVSFTTDIVTGLEKSVIFSLVIGWIAVYQGYYVTPNSYGIASATTRTVVYSAVLILAADMLLTMIMLQNW